MKRRAGKSGTGRGELVELLLALKENLADDVLAASLPEIKPARAREALLEAARILSPRPEQLSLSRDFSGAGTQKKGRAGGSLALYTDGAARGNPGEAAAGVSIQDDSGAEIYGHGTYLGQCTNNVAEYRALVLGLKAAAEFGPERLDIFMDSELIVKQLQGVYRVKNENLKPLFLEAKELLAGFASFKVRHVRREKNKRADELANEAIDRQLRA